MDESVIKENLFLKYSGYEVFIALPYRLKFSSKEVGDLPDKHAYVRAVYIYAGRLDNGLCIYTFTGVEVL